MSNATQKGDGAGAAPAKKAEQYRVYDMTARHDEVRRHAIITRTYDDGREPETFTYGLQKDKACEMPAEHAMKFLIDPNFRVERPNGERIMPPPKYDPSVPTKVELHQTIADYDELSKGALYKRVKLLPGSEKLTLQSDVKDMVAFLVEARRKQLHGNLSEAEKELAAQMGAGELGGALSQDGVDKLFGERSPLVTA